MGSPKSFRSTSTETIVLSRVNTDRPIIIIGVNIYIHTVLQITILVFSPAGTKGASILANQSGALPTCTAAYCWAQQRWQKQTRSPSAAPASPVWRRKQLVGFIYFI